MMNKSTRNYVKGLEQQSRIAQATRDAAPALLKACRLALLEFERISYLKKTDPEVIAAIEGTISKAEGR